MKQHIYWTYFMYHEWKIPIAVVNDELCFVGGCNETLEHLQAWASRQYLYFELINDTERLSSFNNELLKYLSGSLQSFSIPIQLEGTDFQKRVWKALLNIPYGQTTTYSEIANLIGKPTASRAVGSAIGANPILILVPCHRVIRKNGDLSGFRGGIDMKKRLLELEQSFSKM